MRDISILIASKAWLMDERIATLLYSLFMTGRLDGILGMLQEKSRFPFNGVDAIIETRENVHLQFEK